MSNNNNNNNDDDDGTAPPPSLIRIDGSLGEGGGQILRNSMSYACIFQQPIQITKIRAKRSKPGLKAQHLVGIQLCSRIGGGSLQGDELNSMDITYQPPQQELESAVEELQPEYVGEISTAGSICLLLQAALPCVLFSAGSTTTTKLILKGGTNADMAPQWDYWEQIFLPTLSRCLKFRWDSASPSIISPTVLKRGYFPKGGGHVEIEVNLPPQATPLKFPAFEMTDPGTLQHIQIRSFHAGKLPKHLATQMAKSAHRYLRENLDLTSVSVETEIVTEKNAVGSGLGILLAATTSTGCLLGGSALCKPKQKANQAGIAAATELVAAIQQGGCVDEWLQDQLILYMALAKGTSTLLTGCLTLHTQTAVDIATQLVPGVQFTIEKLDNNNDGAHGGGDIDAAKADTKNYGQDGMILGRHKITCRGIGYTRAIAATSASSESAAAAAAAPAQKRKTPPSK